MTDVSASTSSKVVLSLIQSPMFGIERPPEGPAAMKRHYNDPEFRAKMSKALKEAQSRPELRAKRSPMMRELWGRQDFRRQVEKAQAKLRADPEKVRKMTAGLRARNEEAQQQIHCRNGHPWAENRLTNSQGNCVSSMSQRS